MSKCAGLFAICGWLCLLPVVRQTCAAEAEPTIDVVFVGDIMLAELPGEAISRGVDPFAPFATLFGQADATVGNLECVVATVGKQEVKPYTFRANPDCIPLLKRHFSALTVANNHSGDFGHDAIVEQFDLFEREKLPYFGGGRNNVAAHTPLVLERKGIKLALLGYNEFKPRRFEAGVATPGVAWSVDEMVIADIKAAREKYHADLVIPFMHWGWENEPVNDRQRNLARTMIAAGADAVVGAHPHVRQAIEYFHGKPIVYSLGNFVFNGFETEDQFTGWVLTLTLDKTGVRRWHTNVSHIDERGLPHLVADAKSPHGDVESEEILDYTLPYPTALLPDK
jgi:hypothetical protein